MNKNVSLAIEKAVSNLNKIENTDLKDPNNKSIEDLVDSIFKQKIDSGQLIYANITFKEISQLKKLFKKMLKSIYHIRVSYPQDEK